MTGPFEAGPVDCQAVVQGKARVAIANLGDLRIAQAER